MSFKDLSESFSQLGLNSADDTTSVTTSSDPYGELICKVFEECNKSSNHSTSVVKKLLEEGAKVNWRNEKKFTSLMIACKRGHYETVQLLMEVEGLSVNLVDNDGWSAFYFSCWMGNEKIIQSLVDDPRVDVTLSDKNNWSPLMRLAWAGNLNALKIFLCSERVSILHTKQVSSAEEEFHQVGSSAMEIATKKGSKNIVLALQDFIRSPTDTTMKWRKELQLSNKTIFEKFIFASADGDLDEVKSLITKVGLSTKDRKGKDALFYAKYRQQKQIVKILQEHLEQNSNQKYQEESDSMNEKKPNLEKEIRNSNDKDQITTHCVSIEFPYSFINKLTSNFSPQQKIEGEVFKASIHGKGIAAKRFSMDKSNTSKPRSEILILSKYRHPHIVTLLGNTPLDDPNGPCLIYELMLGNLRSKLSRKNGETRLPWEDRVRITYEISTALAFLHQPFPDSPPLLHLDVKSENILLGDNNVSKLSNFSSSMRLKSLEIEQTVEAGGTRGYLCPARLSGGYLSVKSDVYSFGVVMFEMLTGKGVFFEESGNERNLSRYILEKFKPNEEFSEKLLDESIRREWPQNSYQRYAKLALKCIENRPDDRPDMETISKFLLSLLQF